jgi:glycine betaine/choline ABC-type transport system substrate-binding protein
MKRIYEVGQREYELASEVAKKIGLTKGYSAHSFRAFNEMRTHLNYNESYEKRFATYNKTYNESISAAKARLQALKDDEKYQSFYRILSSVKQESK